MTPFRKLSISWLMILLVLGSTPSLSHARPRLENICSIYGQKEVSITGMGLVVGLNGTGDGGKSAPAMRALAAVLKNFNNPVLAERELADAENVAIVLIEATIPKTGLYRGQKIDCHISSFMGATSLRGGRLLLTPMKSAEVNSDLLVGLASGAISLEDPLIATTGRIPGGVTLEQNFASLFTREPGDNKLTLLLDAPHSGFTTASEVARVINTEFSYETSQLQIAKALGPGVIEVQIPRQYAEAPVDFIAQLMEVGIDNPTTQARVVVNPKTQTVIVTGEVEISPVVISHKNLTIDIGAQANPVGTRSFVSVPPLNEDPASSQSGSQSPAQLKQLVESLNQLRVPTSDIISIIRELHRSGKLHAEYLEY